jgi:hypothetical protein
MPRSDGGGSVLLALHWRWALCTLSMRASHICVV